MARTSMILPTLLLAALPSVALANGANPWHTDSETEATESDETDLTRVNPPKRFFHGFRLGYTFINTTPGQDSALLSPHMFVIGYEATQRTIGGSWLNVITVENVSISGINQSLFLPSFNGLVGFEMHERIQVGTGVHIMPFDPNGNYVHQIVAVGWTPTAGTFNVPFHVMFIPDVDGRFRVGGTVGVNW